MPPPRIELGLRGYESLVITVSLQRLGSETVAAHLIVFCPTAFLLTYMDIGHSNAGTVQLPKHRTDR